MRTHPAKPAAHAQPTSFHLQGLLPASYLLVGGSRQVWHAEVEGAPFYEANAEARRAFVTLVDDRIAGGAHPDAMPRGSAAAARAEGLVKSIATEYQLDFDDIAGGCRSVVQLCTGAPLACASPLPASLCSAPLKQGTEALPPSSLPLHRRPAGLHAGQPGSGRGRRGAAGRADQGLRAAAQGVLPAGCLMWGA